MRNILFAATVAFATPLSAQTIYPIDQAQILVGSRFDLKVEFPGAPRQRAVQVSIDGRDASRVLGKQAVFVEKEDGDNRSAYWIRGAQLPAGEVTVEARHGDSSATVHWRVYSTPAAKAKNVILFIGDGLSIAHRTAARMLSKGMKEGRYLGELAIDDMPHMALISTSGTDSIVTDSANSMSAYTTGHKSCSGAMGVYCAANKNSLQHPKVETISEFVQRLRGMAVGIVTNTEVADATPAAMVAHTSRRWEYNDIVKMLYDVRPDVIMGGGAANFLPKGKPGSKRRDNEDYVAKFKTAGYRLVTTDTEMKSASADGKTSKLLGLFNMSYVDGALDRRILKKGTVSSFPDQPDLVDQVKTALAILSRHEKGFVLMAESGAIDKYSHSLDWERAVYDTIMLDNAVKAAKDWAQDRNDTLIIVVADHAHPVSIIGTYDDEKPGQTLRDKLGIYGDAKFPNYPKADPDGYPASVDVSRRLALVFGAAPDHCDSGKPYLAGENEPTVKGPDGAQIPNEIHCNSPVVARRAGNLPFRIKNGVHSADDVILTAMGPGAEMFRGRMDNVAVFRVMASALGLGFVTGTTP